MMEIINELKTSDSRTSVALGFFDGMHKGHRTVIRSAVDGAKYDGLTPAVLTFSEQPKAVVTGTSPELLIAEDRKHQLMNDIGVKKLYCLHFSDLRNISAEDFVDFVLVQKLKAKRVFCGFNYHFGQGGVADCEDLKRLCRLRGIIVTVNNPVLYQGDTISSSRIRNCIKAGDMISACTMLERCFSYKLPVVHGRQLGREIGAPTINQYIPEDAVLPKFGVYASFATIDGVRVPAVTNIGIKPTVGSDKPIMETWIQSDGIDDLYDKDIEVSFIKHLRGEHKFDSLDDLKAAMTKDAQRAVRIFNSLHG